MTFLHVKTILLQRYQKLCARINFYSAQTCCSFVAYIFIDQIYLYIVRVFVCYKICYKLLQTTTKVTKLKGERKMNNRLESLEKMVGATLNQVKAEEIAVDNLIKYSDITNLSVIEIRSHLQLALQDLTNAYKQIQRINSIELQTTVNKGGIK